ncbi:MAG TPA: FadR/GntR family transcriptional regulator [Intrasporangium sp.]|uniref:FadR/GntR family transcriptional regulator n=1 Tax=Intrasporangium sp. TaxID=1925024 RepID=UPI002D79CA77|nr:FadR/GntR family transcriptional regulator [Intrasporangium sp.]HET7396921.1 FadR/GntR family transcriptional regulator [Intrasporangium sp.]
MDRAVAFEHVRPVRLYERIVEQVEDAIVRGELRPGERLPSERELVSQFGTSRSTVREALRVLESNGLVRSRPGDPNGPEVLPFTSRGLTKQLRRLAQADGLGLAELIASRMILDSSANRLAARLRTEEELGTMEAAIDAMRAAVDDGYAAFGEADLAFHDAVAQASRNTLIQVCNLVVRDTVLSLISDRIAHARNARALMRTSLRHHEGVLTAIRARDGRAAAEASRRSLYDYYAGYVPATDRAALKALLED